MNICSILHSKSRPFIRKHFNFIIYSANKNKTIWWTVISKRCNMCGKWFQLKNNLPGTLEALTCFEPLNNTTNSYNEYLSHLDLYAFIDLVSPICLHFELNISKQRLGHKLKDVWSHEETLIHSEDSARKSFSFSI